VTIFSIPFQAPTLAARTCGTLRLRQDQGGAARDDDAPQGEWRIERKTADFPLVIKLTSDALANKSKDLQLAVWLTEALLKQEGFSGFRAGFNFIQNLLETFWDGLYPSWRTTTHRSAPFPWNGWAVAWTSRSGRRRSRARASAG